MAVSSKQPGCELSLLGLPDAVVHKIATGLAPVDKTTFMAACRRAALMMMATPADMTLNITKDTKFAGIRKALDSFPVNIHLQIMCIDQKLEDLKPIFSKPLPALAMFMGMAPTSYITQIASNCRWEGITKATIQGKNLRCLLPQFIAMSCPQLTHLRIIAPDSAQSIVFTGEARDAQPLALCSSLTHLELDVFCAPDLELPPTYHSPAELRQNLPNINTLIMKAANVQLLEAFGTQLTRLEVLTTSFDAEQSMRQCSNLVHLTISEFVLPDNVASLQTLEVYNQDLYTDHEYNQILQLPNLSTLRIYGCVDIQQDYSEHACSWKELHLSEINFTCLGLLSLSSVQKLSWHCHMAVHLPPASLPGSHAQMLRAADNLSHIGKIVLDTSIPEARDGATLLWGVISEDDHQEAAEQLATAAQRIGPVKTCKLHNLLRAPLLLRAVMHWGQQFLETVCFENNFDHVQPHVWHALQQLQKLHTVLVWPSGSSAVLLTQALLDLSSVVCSAAQHYVIPSNRSLCIRGVVQKFYTFPEHDLQTEIPFLRAAILEGLPANTKLSSIEIGTNPSSPIYESHKKAWVISVTPSHVVA